MTDTAAIEKANGGQRALATTPPRNEWDIMRAQATDLVASGFLPKAINTWQKALMVMQTGRELGLGPAESFRSIHIIEGKPTLSAALMAGLALRRVQGGVLRVVECTAQRCVIDAFRPGYDKPARFMWTIDQAKLAGLVGKDNWRKYPGPMLLARCQAAAARAVFPDAVAGLYDPDELGAVTNESGEVVAMVTPSTPVETLEARGESPPSADIVRDLADAILNATDDDAIAAVGKAANSAAKAGHITKDDVRQLASYAQERRAALAAAPSREPGDDTDEAAPEAP